MSEKNQHKRWRCLQTGCNPKLNEATAAKHKAEVGHRVAKWPIRSPEGKAKASARNKSGYYDQYNVGPKSASARGFYNSGGGRAAAVSDGESDWEDDDQSWDAHKSY